MAEAVGVVVIVGVGVMVGVSVGVGVFVELGVMVGVGVLVGKSVKPPLLKDITTMIIPTTTSRTAAPPRINGSIRLRRLR
jgi:tetrahydrodipicolinate N-succinyltransferase